MEVSYLQIPEMKQFSTNIPVSRYFFCDSVGLKYTDGKNIPKVYDLVSISINVRFPDIELVVLY